MRFFNTALMIFMFLVATFKLDFVDSSGINTTVFKKNQGLHACVRKIHCHNQGFPVITVHDLVGEWTIHKKSTM